MTFNVSFLKFCDNHPKRWVARKNKWYNFLFQIFLWVLKDNDLTGMAFIDTQLYIHQMFSIKNFILAADLMKSISLLRYQEESKTLSLVSRVRRKRHDSMGGACPRLKRLSFQVFPNEVRVVNSQERCAVWECKSGLSNRGYSTQWRVYWWRSVSDYWCLSARFILTRAALAAGDDPGACSLLCWVLTLFLLFWQQDAKPLEVYSIEFMVDNNQLGFLGNVWNNLYFTKTNNNNKETLMIKSFSHKAFLFSCFQCRIETRTSMFTCICLKVRAVDVL